MTFKIEICQLYDKSEGKQWKWNKIRHFSIRHIQIWHHIFFYQNISTYFNDFRNQNFSALWLKWAQTMEMKQNQTFCMEQTQSWHHIFFYQNMLEYFNDFQNQNFSVFWLKWAQTTEMKKIKHFSMEHVQIWHYFSLVAKY